MAAEIEGCEFDVADGEFFRGWESKVNIWRDGDIAEGGKHTRVQCRLHDSDTIVLWAVRASASSSY